MRCYLTANCFALFIISFCLVSAASAKRADWAQEKVDWRIGNGLHIRGIEYPPAKRPHILTKNEKPQPPRHEKIIVPRAGVSSAAQAPSTATSVTAAVTISPPINGFVPWVAVTATDASNWDDWAAVPEPTVTGTYLAANPQNNYALGIFDTGAGTYVIGYNSSQTIGLQNPTYLTDYTSTITGVTGMVDATISESIAVFIAGLNAIDASRVLDTSQLKGQSNVRVLVGQDNAPLPDIITAIGAPLAVYYTTVFRNDRPQTVVYDGNEYSAPEITMYEPGDAAIPNLTNYNYISLELRPTGAYDVEYIDIPEFDIWTPSVIGGFNQSLFYVSSVILYESAKPPAIEKTGFIVDTGAEVSVISTAVATRLGFVKTNPEFVVDVQGVDGQIIHAPGFYVESIQIPAQGEWYEATNVPVIALDVLGPEYSILDGIIGMNLFAHANLVLDGGAFDILNPPLLYFAFPPAGDFSGDGKVDYTDLAAFARSWLAAPTSQNWDSYCDISPPGGNNKVNFADFAVMAENWL
jgi:hypothetical protein